MMVINAQDKPSTTSGFSIILLLLSYFLQLCLPICVKAQPSEAHPWEHQMEALGLVDVQALDSSIIVDLRYATPDNFVGKDLYKGFSKAYLSKSFALQLVRAHRLLKEDHPNYRFIIYDAARPVSVQKQMYALVRGTPKHVYVAYPNPGGRHNYGAAVDLSIFDIRTQKAVDMGTGFDFFGPEAHVGQEATLVRDHKISAIAMQNRQLLYSIMRQVGLRPYRREWWHYEENIPINEVRARHRLLDF